MKRIKTDARWLLEFVTSPRFLAGVCGTWLIDAVHSRDWVLIGVFTALASFWVAMDEVSTRKGLRVLNELIEFEKEKSRVEALDPTARLARPTHLRGRSQR